jgi:hypothetical protein
VTPPRPTRPTEPFRQVAQASATASRTWRASTRPSRTGLRSRPTSAVRARPTKRRACATCRPEAPQQRRSNFRPHPRRNDRPTYAFENDNADTPTTSTLPLGAFHNAENPFLFPSGTLTFTPDQAAFGDQIVAEWSRFARTGNSAVPGAPQWTRYTPNRQNVMSLAPAGDSALVSAAAINPSAQLRVLQRSQPQRSLGHLVIRACRRSRPSAGGRDRHRVAQSYFDARRPSVRAPSISPKSRSAMS